MNNGGVGTLEDDAAAFSLLGTDLRAALSERGFETPTKPQRRALPPLIDSENVVVVAPTGSGKTETAMLPVFDQIVGEETFGISALYITPLRALNRDMEERLEWWGQTLDIDIDIRHGDTTDYQRQKQANDPPDVLVTTPETLQAMFTGEKLKRALEDVEHVIIDEIHELAVSKRGAQLSIGLEHLRELAGPMQRIGLSATVDDPDEIGKLLTGDRDYTVAGVDIGSELDVDVRCPTPTERDEQIASELVTDPEIASHVRVIDELVAENEATLIFVNTRQTAEAIGSRLKEYGSNVGIHHGSLAKESRIEIESQFKNGEIDGLMCTSSMELGIDVGHVDHVVQYNSPRQVTRLLQRIGRAGHREDEISSGTIIASHPDDVLESIVIGHSAQDGHVEPAAIHHGSLDTVANQIAGLVMGCGDIQAMHAYEIITRAYPFQDLSTEQFKEIVRELASNNVVWLEEDADRLEKRRGTWQYFYRNLSMIPDEATYDVEDVASGRQVGTLDERFVVNFASPGEIFIQGGEMWRITEVDDEDDVVTVSPIEDPAGEVPSWTGQEIPVTRQVAQHVGQVRAVASSQLAEGAEESAVARDLGRRYDFGTETIEAGLDQLTDQAETGHPVATEDRIVVEGGAGSLVVNACFGHNINETLGRLLSALLGQQTGSSVGMEVDPYRIELDVPHGVSHADVEAILHDTDPEHVRGLIELSLKNADALKFKLAQVAATFGAVKRWRGSGSTGFGKNRLLDALEGTPVYDEALRELIHEELSIEGAQEVLASVQSGEITIDTVGEHTPVGIGGRGSGTELLTPENADASVIKTVKERLQGDRVILFCLHCEEYERTKEVNRVRDQPSCPHCESTRIAALNPWDEETVTAVRTNNKDDDQQKRTERAYQAASLVQSHGKQAVIALAARGVGPHNAARIINKLRENEDDFYRDILSREREYARTRSFWE
ncbi:DEAD/DEAH box helicase [Halovenus halobia]|uniref:DEAD/DEAH box helicase n=1 Tax=Halovenus halobia TaxID=3396622 RepID=UPI003F56D739